MRWYSACIVFQLVRYPEGISFRRINMKWLHQNAYTAKKKTVI